MTEERSRLQERARKALKTAPQLDKFTFLLETMLADFAESEMRRAALEDAPANPRLIDAIRDAVENFCGHDWPDGKPLPDFCPECSRIVEAVMAKLPGVLSEAAPSKENAPEVLPVCEICGDTEYWHFRNLLGSRAAGHAFKPAATAPAVQGTPFKDAVLAMGGNESDAKAALLRAHAEGRVEIDLDWNVGTPQKETPPMKLPEQRIRVQGWDGDLVHDCFYGHGQRDGEICWRTTHDEKPVRYPILRWVPFFNFKTAPVPEGVQGKEPSITERERALVRAFESGEAAGRRWKLAIKEACIVNHINFYPEDAQKSLSNLIAWETKIALDPKVSKEAAELLAAGGRSAITERIAVLKEAAAAQCDFCGDRFTYDKAPRTEPEHIERVYVCNYGEVQGWAHGGGYVEYLPCDAGRIWDVISK